MYVKSVCTRARVINYLHFVVYPNEIVGTSLLGYYLSVIGIHWSAINGSLEAFIYWTLHL